MTTVLVTGATGYIGSHVCKNLKAAGHVVIGLDLVRRDHAVKHMHEFVQGDYCSDVMADLLSEHLPDAVVHCAGTSLVGPSLEDPAEYYVNNVAKTAKFLDMLRWIPNIPAVVFSSSAAVYGNPDVDMIYENQPYNPVSPYGQTKSMIEIMLVDFCRAYGMRSASLRYFNACGADLDGELGQAPGATHIIARLLESKKANQKFTLYGTDYPTPDGTCIRDYVHVVDLAEAHQLAVEYLLSGQEECFAVNLGGGQGHSNSEVISAAESVVGNISIQPGVRRLGDPARLVAGTMAAKTKLGWTPEHSDLKTIIESAWNWYNNPPQPIDNLSK
jgi:UDP-glucose-4-epimerase GalE